MDAKLIDSGITYLLIFNFVSYYRYIIRLRKLNCLFQHKIFHIFRQKTKEEIAKEITLCAAKVKIKNWL